MKACFRSTLLPTGLLAQVQVLGSSSPLPLRLLSGPVPAASIKWIVVKGLTGQPEAFSTPPVPKESGNQSVMPFVGVLATTSPSMPNPAGGRNGAVPPCTPRQLKVVLSVKVVVAVKPEVWPVEI